MDFARPIDDGHHLVLILFLPDLSKGMTTLVWIIAIHNVFASLQDVSVDALAVDLLPEKERGKANGFMRAASYLGSIIGGSVMGVITARHGLHLAISLQVGIMLLVMCAPLFLRERDGERLFPGNHSIRITWCHNFPEKPQLRLPPSANR